MAGVYNQISRYYLLNLPPEVRRQFLMIMPRYDYRYEAIENIRIRQAMEQYGLSTEAINLISGIIPTVGSLIYHSYESELNSEYTVDFENLYRIPGGMVKLPMAFYNSLFSQNPLEYPGIPLSAFGKVTWRSSVVNGIIRSDKDGKVTLRHRGLSEDHDNFENFDYVVCAVPFTTLRPMDIFPPFRDNKMQAIREVYYEDAQKTLFLCRERFWEKQDIFGGISYVKCI
jgi:monoamine oxidase